MKGIILAAGIGSRLGRYTKDRPKGMLAFAGKPLIQWQIDAMRKAGVDDVIIITGYRAECIDFPNVRYLHNERFAATNMIETLMCARREFDDSLLVTYSDIVYDAAFAVAVAEAPYDIAVAVDGHWRRYWRLRYGTTETDLETLTISHDGRITELGRPVSHSEGIDYRYVGLLKFSKKGIAAAEEIYDRQRETGLCWQPSGNPFLQGYMTDWLNTLIAAHQDVWPVVQCNGWLEFDTENDLKAAHDALRNGSLGPVFRVP